MSFCISISFVGLAVPSAITKYLFSLGYLYVILMRNLTLKLMYIIDIAKVAGLKFVLSGLALSSLNVIIMYTNRLNLDKRMRMKS